MQRPECLFFHLFKLYIIFGWAARGRMTLLRARARLLRLRLRLFFMMPMIPGVLILPLTHSISIPHVPELLPHMARRAEHGHQEVEHKLVQQIKNNDEKKYFG
jgi:hypothetical protein